MKNKFKISREVLLQLAENNSFSEKLIRKEFPQLFEGELEVGKWYKSTYINQNGVKSLFLAYIDDLEKQLNYGFDFKGEFKTNMYFKNDSNSLVLATPQEVETAFKDLFIKLGFVKGKVFKCLGTNREITIKNPDLDFDNFKTDNIIYIDDYQVFNNGKLATIIETPNDIITIVEKYGKDKVISLIEKYESKPHLF